jgi:hypothetical protein
VLLPTSPLRAGLAVVPRGAAAAAAVLAGRLRPACGSRFLPLFAARDRSAAGDQRFWALVGAGASAQQRLLSGKPRAATKNPGQKARSRKPEYAIPAWTAPPARILAAAVVERLPVLTPDPEPWEMAMWDLQERKSAAMQKPLPDDWFRGALCFLRAPAPARGFQAPLAVEGFKLVCGCGLAPGALSPRSERAGH